MDIEQRPPERPNFKLIVGLFAATIVLALIAAMVFMRRESRSLPSGERDQRTHSSSPVPQPGGKDA